MKKIVNYFAEKQISALERERKRTGISIAEIVRRAVDEYFEKRHERK